MWRWKSGQGEGEPSESVLVWAVVSEAETPPLYAAIIFRVA